MIQKLKAIKWKLPSNNISAQKKITRKSKKEWQTRKKYNSNSCHEEIKKKRIKQHKKLARYMIRHVTENEYRQISNISKEEIIKIYNKTQPVKHLSPHKRSKDEKCDNTLATWQREADAHTWLADYNWHHFYGAESSTIKIEQSPSSKNSSHRYTSTFIK